MDYGVRMACQLKSRFDAPGSLPKNTNSVAVMFPTYHPVNAFVGSSVNVIVMSLAVGV